MTTQEIMADFCAKVCNLTKQMELGNVSKEDYTSLMMNACNGFVSAIDQRMEEVLNNLKCKGGE